MTDFFALFLSLFVKDFLKFSTYTLKREHGYRVYILFLKFL